MPIHRMATNLRNPLSLAVPTRDNLQIFPANPATLNALPESVPEQRNLWDGSERRVAHLAVAKEQRKCYLFDTPSFQHRAEQVRAELMSYSQELRQLPVSKAAELWLEQKSLYNRSSTIECYRDYIKRLVAFFEPPDKAPLVATLDGIHVGHFVSYQSKHKPHYHAASINHDLNTLSQIMKKAGLWTAAIQEHYKPLPLPEADPIKVMSEAEEDKFFAFASKNPEWWLAYWVASLTNNSTASGKELRMLKLEAIHLDENPPCFQVPKNMKTPQRQRKIPLNERGATIMERLIKRANSLGSTRPEHYLFPFRVKRNLFDPLRPASESWIKYRWKMLVDAALEAGVISFRIKPHNLRHQAMTKLLDYGVPIEVVRQIAGHGVDSLITRHYHHGRMETMANALSAIDPDRKRPISTNGKGKAVKNAG